MAYAARDGCLGVTHLFLASLRLSCRGELTDYKADLLCRCVCVGGGGLNGGEGHVLFSSVESPR